MPLVLGRNRPPARGLSYLSVSFKSLGGWTRHTQHAISKGNAAYSMNRRELDLPGVILRAKLAIIR